jgi:lysophospholipase L1-like esterase
MIQKIKFLAIVLSLITFNACNKDEDFSPTQQSTSINKILTLGASRVEGSRPEFESYRYELWKDLKENNWIFDFIGTQTDESSYPTFNNMNFDVDHEGRSGWTSGEILNGLGDWLNQTGSADIVLLSSPGGNDALEGLPYSEAVSNINYIIDILQADNPSITIILEQMAPGRSDIMTSELTEFFTQMQQEVLNIAANKTTTTSSVMAVDMFTGFNDNLLADDVHYNEAGAVFIANRYYTILINVLE